MQSIFSVLRTDNNSHLSNNNSKELNNHSNLSGKMFGMEGVADTVYATGTTLVDAVVDATASGLGAAIGTSIGAVGGSLTSLSAPLQVQPVVIVSANASNAPFYDDSLKTVQEVFAMYYMQAVTVLTVPDNNNIFRILRALNPARESLTNATKYIGRKLNLDFIKKPNISNEENTSSIGKKDFKGSPVLGSTYTVEVTTKDNKYSLNINVSLSPTVIPNDIMNDIMIDSSTLVETLERYHAWRGGRISFFNLISGIDIIQKRKEIAVKDTNGIYNSIVKRKNSKIAGWLFSFVTRGGSGNNTYDNTVIAGAYKAGANTNIIMITEAEKQAYEMAAKTKLNNYASRQTLMDAMHAFMLVVLDREFNRVTLYYKDIRDGQTVSSKYLKGAGGNSDALTEMFKAFSQGSVPSF